MHYILMLFLCSFYFYSGKYVIMFLKTSFLSELDKQTVLTDNFLALYLKILKKKIHFKHKQATEQKISIKTSTLRCVSIEKHGN